MNDRKEARVLCRLAWNNWPDNEHSRKQISEHEARDHISAAAWDRVIDALLRATKSAPALDASHNSGERERLVIAAYAGADPLQQTPEERCAEVADRAAEADKEWAAKYPDEAEKMLQRAHRARTIADAIRALPPS